MDVLSKVQNNLSKTALHLGISVFFAEKIFELYVEKHWLEEKKRFFVKKMYLQDEKIPDGIHQSKIGDLYTKIIDWIGSTLDSKKLAYDNETYNDLLPKINHCEIDNEIETKIKSLLDIYFHVDILYEDYLSKKIVDVSFSKGNEKITGSISLFALFLFSNPSIENPQIIVHDQTYDYKDIDIENFTFTIQL